MLLDFVFQKRYGTTRYILPSILGIQLAVAYLFSTKIASISTKDWQKKLWLTSSINGNDGRSYILYCFTPKPLRGGTKYLKDIEVYPRIAEIINQSNKPLLISDHGIKLQLLGHLLDPKVRFQFPPKSQLPEITEGFTDVFLFDLFDYSEYLKAGVEKIYNSKLEQINKLLWKLSPKQ